ncbi:unnamed protein product [Mytilus coruscus]|uniref:Uncharacterized protein n=1 Tax=Mytilus coruscus TaxID=42192 RepID=A0A6J8F2L8_MYTCO|nr:unnamed protein product [Mytilus coruscus]
MGYEILTSQMSHDDTKQEEYCSYSHTYKLLAINKGNNIFESETDETYYNKSLNFIYQAFHLVYLKRLYTSLQILNVLDDGQPQYPLLNRYFHLAYLNQSICQPVSLLYQVFAKMYPLPTKCMPACILTITDNGLRIIHFENGSVVDDPDGIVDSSTVFLQQLQASYPELVKEYHYLRM